MDHAVGLVQAYLRLNGYFTVTEFPVVLPTAGAGYRTVTDLDILAVRFPHVSAAASEANPPHRGAGLTLSDPALAAPEDQPDMLIGEVKEGGAELNAGATNPEVVEAVLRRFGCCDESSAPQVVRELHRRGHAVLPNGHPARLVAFGSFADPGAGGRYLRVTHGHVLQFMERYIRTYWDRVRVGEAKDPAFGLLLLIEKARRGR